MAFDYPMQSNKSEHPSKALRKYSETETMAEWFFATLTNDVNEKACEKFNVSSKSDWIGNRFTVEWVAKTTNDPAGIKFTCDRQNAAFRKSAIPGLCKVLKELGYTFIRATDKRFKNNRGDKEIIVTGHTMTGGELPAEILNSIE